MAVESPSGKELLEALVEHGPFAPKSSARALYTERISAIEEEAVRADHQRLKDYFSKLKSTCTCGLGLMYGDALPWGVQHAEKCAAASNATYDAILKVL